MSLFEELFFHIVESFDSKLDVFVGLLLWFVFQSPSVTAQLPWSVMKCWPLMIHVSPVSARYLNALLFCKVLCIDMEWWHLCVCLGFDVDVYSSGLPSSQLPSRSSAHTPWFLLPHLWWYKNTPSEIIQCRFFQCMCAHLYLFVVECVLEGDKTHVPNGQRWTDKDNECITCICNVRKLKWNYHETISGETKQQQHNFNKKLI